MIVVSFTTTIGALFLMTIVMIWTLVTNQFIINNLLSINECDSRRPKTPVDRPKFFVCLFLIGLMPFVMMNIFLEAI